MVRPSKRLLVLAALSAAGSATGACNGTTTTTHEPHAPTAAHADGSSSVALPGTPVPPLPPAAKAVRAEDLAADATCGPFKFKDLDAPDAALLDDRVRTRFFKTSTAAGDATSGKLQVEAKGATLFVGARETFQRGDADFERHATRVATFGGTYDAVTIPGRDASVSVVTGIAREAAPGGGIMAVAHGWFLDPNRDVVDIAVFVSADTFAANVAQCRLFAQKIVHSAAVGPRRLAYGKTGSAEETVVSYSTFQYKLPPEWMVASSMGIHDFSRMHFRKRGIFPSGGTDLQIALDTHPGDWNSPGEAEGKRKGKVLDMPVTWTLTKDVSPPPVFGAWTISETVVNRDHAVASLHAASIADREEAIRFAESIRVKR